MTIKTALFAPTTEGRITIAPIDIEITHGLFVGDLKTCHKNKTTATTVGNNLE